MRLKAAIIAIFTGLDSGFRFAADSAGRMIARLHRDVICMQRSRDHGLAHASAIVLAGAAGAASLLPLM
jgi:hypothetical protein